jgi:hypothetical protein
MHPDTEVGLVDIANAVLSGRNPVVIDVATN